MLPQPICKRFILCKSVLHLSQQNTHRYGHAHECNCTLNIPTLNAPRGPKPWKKQKDQERRDETPMTKACDAKTKREVKAHRDMHSIDLTKPKSNRQLLQETMLAKTPRSRKAQEHYKSQGCCPRGHKKRWWNQTAV